MPPFCRYLTSDGQEREETGILIKAKQGVFMRVKGFYAFTGGNGKRTKVYYRADEKGSAYRNADDSQLEPISSEPHLPPSENTAPILSPFQPRPPPITTMTLQGPEISSSAVASLAGGGFG